MGRALAEQRQKQSLTQERAAVLSGYSLRYYQRLEAGSKTPPLKTIFRIAKAIGVHPGKIINPAWDAYAKEK